MAGTKSGFIAALAAVFGLTPGNVCVDANEEEAFACTIEVGCGLVVPAGTDASPAVVVGAEVDGPGAVADGVTAGPDAD